MGIRIMARNESPSSSANSRPFRRVRQVVYTHIHTISQLARMNTTDMTDWQRVSGLQELDGEVQKARTNVVLLFPTRGLEEVSEEGGDEGQNGLTGASALRDLHQSTCTRQTDRQTDRQKDRLVKGTVVPFHGNPP